jgi:hypothetical protein
LYILLEKCILDPKKLKEELINAQQQIPKTPQSVIHSQQPNCYQLKKIDSAFISKIEFRAAFVLEAIYLSKQKNLLDKFLPNLFLLLPKITNPSTKRHFGKIVCKEIEANSRNLSQNTLCSVLETMQEWAITPHAKPAVKIWAINTLFAIRNIYIGESLYIKDSSSSSITTAASDTNKVQNLHTLETFLNDFIEYESTNPLPSMIVSLRLWRKRLPQG